MNKAHESVISQVSYKHTTHDLARRIKMIICSILVPQLSDHVDTSFIYGDNAYIGD